MWNDGEDNLKREKTSKISQDQVISDGNNCKKMRKQFEMKIGHR